MNFYNWNDRELRNLAADRKVNGPIEEIMTDAVKSYGEYVISYPSDCVLAFMDLPIVVRPVNFLEPYIGMIGYVIPALIALAIAIVCGIWAILYYPIYYFRQKRAVRKFISMCKEEDRWKRRQDAFRMLADYADKQSNFEASVLGNTIRSLAYDFMESERK